MTRCRRCGRERQWSFAIRTNAWKAILLCVSVNWNGLAPSFSVVAENFPDWKSWCLFAAAFIASFKFKVNPILLIVVAGVLGLLLY